MNCRQSQHLLSLDRDNQLPAGRRPALEAHLTTCADCRQHHTTLTTALDTLQANSARIKTPDTQAEWHLLRARLNQPGRVTTKRGIPTWGWLAGLGLPAAVACLALVLINNRPAANTATTAQVAQAPARAEFVELGNVDATPVVYLDQESGWLIVWAEGA